MWLTLNNKFNIKGQYYYQWPFIKNINIIYNQYDMFEFFIDSIYNNNITYIKKFINGSSQGNIRVYFICG